MRRLRIVPYSSYDVPAIEFWLEEMARRGLHLDTFVGQYALFNKGEPTEVRYRLEPWAESAVLDEEMKSIYETAGWEYVQKIMNEHFHLWRSVRPDARELHDDPIVQSYGFEWAEKRARTMLLVWVALMALMAALIVTGVYSYTVRPWNNPWPKPHWITQYDHMAGILLMDLCWLYLSVMDYLCARRVRRSLQTGVQLERRWGGFPYRGVICTVTLAAALTLIAVLAVLT